MGRRKLRRKGRTARSRRSLLPVLALAAILTALPPSAGARPDLTPTASYIVVLELGADRAAAAGAVRSAGGEVTLEYRHALHGFAATLPAAAAEALARQPGVRFVAEDRELGAAAAPAPPPELNPQVTQRSVDRIDAERSSARSGDGRGSVDVNVAVLDSGIDVDHPDLNVVGGVNCLNDGGGFEDTYGHGTLVAGSIAARDNEIGFVGVAPGARLHAVRVLAHNGMANVSRVICGIDWVTGTRLDADPGNDIAVGNMSLGGGDRDSDCGPTSKDALHLAVCRSVAAGVVWVTAAGNEGDDLERYTPATYDEVLTVTAMSDTDGLPGGKGGPEVRCGLGTPDDAAAFFSNYATLAEDTVHTVAAPGVCVPSTYLDGLYGRGSGTSFAAPLVAGAVALCIASGPCAGLTPAEIVAKIVADSAAANAGRANAGYGFDGDPLRPAGGRWYGHLIRVAGY